MRGRTADGKTGHERHQRIFSTQFCFAKLLRTGNQLCLSYYVIPSAARSKCRVLETCLNSTYSLLRNFAVEQKCSRPAAVKRVLRTLTSFPPPQVCPQANLYRNVFKSHLPVCRARIFRLNSGCLDDDGNFCDIVKIFWAERTDLESLRNSIISVLSEIKKYRSAQNKMPESV